MHDLAIRPKGRDSYDVNGAILDRVFVGNGGTCNDTGTWVQAPAQYDETLKAAVHANGQLYVPKVEVQSGAAFEAVLDSSALSAAAIANLLTVATEREHDGPWDGVHFDLEGISNDYRNALTAWYTDAIAALHTEGLTVEITFGPYTDLSHNVAALSEIADSMIPMLYASDQLYLMRSALDSKLDEGLDNQICYAGIELTSRYLADDAAWYHVSHAYASDVLTDAGESTRWVELGAGGRWAFPRATWDTEDLRLRDETSLPILLSLVDEYNLAGASLFGMGSEKAEVWPVVAAWKAGATHWHGYIALERVDMAAGDFTTLLNYAKAQGQRFRQQPCWLTHWKTIDANTVLIEAKWGYGEATAAHCDDWLGALLDVDVGDIGHTNTTVTYAVRETPVTLFSHGGTDYLRLRILGGLDATWEQSQVEALAYL